MVSVRVCVVQRGTGCHMHMRASYINIYIYIYDTITKSTEKPTPAVLSTKANVAKIKLVIPRDATM